MIPVLDLINGAGTIVIEASVTASSGPVSAVRTWTYTKTMMTFPNAGSIAELTKDGKVMWPETLAEAVRIPGGKTLDQVMGFPAQVYAGSYVGTGTSGQANPNSLTFPFEPKLVFVRGVNISTTHGSFFVHDAKYALVLEGGSSQQRVLYVSWEQTSVSWYSKDQFDGEAAQMNDENQQYCYVAIG